MWKKNISHLVKLPLYFVWHINCTKTTKRKHSTCHSHLVGFKSPLPASARVIGSSKKVGGSGKDLSNKKVGTTRSLDKTATPTWSICLLFLFSRYSLSITITNPKQHQKPCVNEKLLKKKHQKKHDIMCVSNNARARFLVVDSLAKCCICWPSPRLQLGHR